MDIKLKISSFASWFFGILFAFIGMFTVFSEPIPGLVALIMAAVLLPPINKLVESKWKLNLSKSAKIIIFIICFIVFSATINISETTQDKITNNNFQVTKQQKNQTADIKSQVTDTIKENEVKQSEIKILPYEIIETETQKKGGNIYPPIPPKFTLITARVVISDDKFDFTKDRVKATLDTIFKILKDKYNPDGITIWAYDRKADIDDMYTLAMAEWWPKGHSFLLNNAENIENKSTYETTYNIKDKTTEEKPTELEFKIYDRLNELLDKEEGNPLYEIMPINLSREEALEWMSQNLEAVQKHEDEQKEEVAKEFNISIKKVDQIHIKVATYQF